MKRGSVLDTIFITCKGFGANGGPRINVFFRVGLITSFVLGRIHLGNIDNAYWFAMIGSSYADSQYLVSFVS